MWTFIAMAPDGRELARETGGRDAEARVRAVVERFNWYLPRLATKVAFVKTVPTHRMGDDTYTDVHGETHRLSLGS
jgi:hypothetical protein